MFRLSMTHVLAVVALLLLAQSAVADGTVPRVAVPPQSGVASASAARPVVPQPQQPAKQNPIASAFAQLIRWQTDEAKDPHPQVTQERLAKGLEVDARDRLSAGGAARSAAVNPARPSTAPSRPSAAPAQSNIAKRTPRFQQMNAALEAAVESAIAPLPGVGKSCGTEGGTCVAGPAGCDRSKGLFVIKWSMCQVPAMCCVPVKMSRPAAAPITPRPAAVPVPTPAPRPAAPVVAPAAPAAPVAANGGWYPSAARVTRGMRAGPAFPKGGKYKIVLHTTESNSFASANAAYRANKVNPHFTVSIENGVFGVLQHVPVTHSSSALRRATGCESNKGHAIQIEIVGSAAKSDAFSSAYLDGIGALLRWIKSQTNVQASVGNARFIAYRDQKPSSYGKSNGVRFNCAQWTAFNGVCGHMHVPDNDHGDPGALNVARLVQLMALPSNTPQPRHRTDLSALNL